jgi:hypothetical protein
MKRTWLFLTLVLMCFVCACHSTPARYGATVDYELLEPEPSLLAGHRAYTVHSWEVVRIESEAPLRLGVVSRGITSFENASPERGAILFRAPLHGETLLIPGEHRAFRISSHAPAYGWFAIEDAAFAWADSPLGTPFPALAPDVRIPVADAKLLDASLAQKGEEARSLRRLYALRVVEALRETAGYPFYDAKDIELPGAVRDVEDHAYHRGERQLFTVQGPAMVRIFARAIRTATVAEIGLTVLEAKPGSAPRMRALANAFVSPLSKTPPTSADPDPDLAVVPRALLYVPTGTHPYVLQTQGAGSWIRLERAVPLRHLQDAWKKDIALLEESALKLCNGSQSAAQSRDACLFAQAITGKEQAASPETSKAVHELAEHLSLSGPNPPSRAIEQGALGLPLLNDQRTREVDQEVRHTAATVFDQSSLWTAAVPNTEAWTVISSEGIAPSECGAKSGPRDLTRESARYRTQLFRGARALTLAVTADCNENLPITLEVDGTKISAQPESASSTWHILVKNEFSVVRRLDGGTAKIQASEASSDVCTPNLRSMFAAQKLLTPAPLALAFAGIGASEPSGTRGVEVWIAAEARSEHLRLLGGDVVLADATIEQPSVTVTEASDAAGKHFRLAGTVAIPASARTITASGGPGLAVRTMLRTSKVEAVPVVASGMATLDEKVLTMRSADVLAHEGAARGKALRDRALVLAKSGAEKAALEDARAADRLGENATSKSSEAEIQSVLIPWQARALELAPNQLAYGLEPAFEPMAKRCKVDPGAPRAQIASLEGIFREKPKQAQQAWDPLLLGQSAKLTRTAAADPRVVHLLSRAQLSSRWQSRLDLPLPRIPKPDLVPGAPEQQVPPLDGDGYLRARVALGAPFGGRDYAVISAERPARATLTKAQASGIHVHYVCAARKPSIPSPCPFEVLLDDKSIFQAKNESGIFDIPESALSRAPQLELRVAATTADKVVAAQIVFDRAFPGAVPTHDGKGFTLPNPRTQYRMLLGAQATLKVPVAAATVLRVEARAETPGASVSAAFASEKREFAADGLVQYVEVAQPGVVLLTAVGGAVTLTVQERTADPENTGAAEESDLRAGIGVPVSISGANEGTWRDKVHASEVPLSPFIENLGTFNPGASFVLSTLREGVRDSRAPDAYGEFQLSYRRTIESIKLTTFVGGNARIRNDAPSLGGTLSLYENIERYRLRVFGVVNAWTQVYEGARASSVVPRAFIEYSFHATNTFFILPRLGYEGFYTFNPPTKGARYLDDDVYNSFRGNRPSLAFLQSLFWFAPHFNDVFYVRLRGSYDLGGARFSHATARPGVFLAAGPFDLGAFYNLSWFLATPGARAASSFDSTVSANATLVGWLSDKSIGLQPGAAAQVRIDDGAYQMSVYLNLLLSARRGIRDFSSLELNFPEAASAGAR